MARLLVALALSALFAAPSGAQTGRDAGRAKEAAAPAFTEKEENFRQHIRRRDDQVDARAEVRRIQNFASAAAGRVDRFFGSLPAVDFADDLNRVVQAELARLDRPDAAPAAVPADPRRGLRQADAGAARPPPLPAASAAAAAAAAAAAPRNGRDPAAAPQDALRAAVAAFPDHDHAPLLAELRMSVQELRLNLSQKHMHWASKFEDLMRGWEGKLRKASGADAVDVLRRLPGPPAGANGGREQGPAADDEAKPFAAKHREVLVRASEALKARPAMADVREAVQAEIGRFGNEITTVGDAYDRHMEEVEKHLVKTADGIFGEDINSNVFTYLLGLFAAIFLLIMVGPMLYKRTTIAENLLKAEFLLQFSTVFILTAAIIILGIGGFIEKDQLPVLLAGISGYVLGQLGRTGADIVRNAPKLEGAAASEPNPRNDNQPAGPAGQRTG